MHGPNIERAKEHPDSWLVPQQSHVSCWWRQRSIKNHGINSRTPSPVSSSFVVAAATAAAAAVAAAVFVVWG